MKKKKEKLIKSGLITVIAGSQLFSLAPASVWAEENKTVDETKVEKEQNQKPLVASKVEGNKVVEGSKVEKEEEERGINWIAKGKIGRYNKEPFNQSTMKDGKLDLQYAVDISLGTQLWEKSNMLIKMPETLNNIRKQAEEKGFDFRKYITVSVKHPDPITGLTQSKKNYAWHEIGLKYDDSLVLEVPKSTFLLWANFTTDITFNYGNLIRESGIIPNKGNNDEVEFAWTPEIMDWTVIGDKKVRQNVNPLIIGDSIERPTINAEDKVINVGDKFDPLEGVSATDGQGNPLKIEVESNNVDSNKPGDYQVKYSATDKYGNRTEKTIKVTVKEKDPTEKPTIYAENKTINVGDEFDPKKGVFAIDAEGHILDVKVVENTVNTKVPGDYIVRYSATDSYGNTGEKTIVVKVKEKDPTEKPTIYAENKIIYVGDDFNPMKDVFAIDTEGRILSVDVVDNTVDTKVPGDYIVKYSATDRYGNTAEKTITVKVKAKDPTEKPTIYAEDKTINVGDEFDPMKNVFAVDSEGHIIPVNVEINTVDTKEPGNYFVMYSAIDKYENKTEKVITVKVKAK